MTYLAHLTINTGHSRNSYWHEAGEQAVHSIGGILAQALAAEGRSIAIPAAPPFRLSAAADGPSLVASVWCRLPDGTDAPVAMIAVAAEGRAATRVWREQLAVADRLGIAYPANIAKPPAPWCSVLLLPYYAVVQHDARWLPDFERDLAWSWLQIRETRND